MNIKREMKDLLMITFAGVIYAAGLSLFLDPNQLAPGGVSGIAVILNRLTGIETGTLYLLLNVPLVLLGIWKFGFRVMGKTAFSIVTTSLFTNMLSPIGALTEDLFIASVAGAALLAVGIGLVFRAGATTGGTDIIIKLLRLKFRHLKTGFLFQCTDLLIVGCSGLVFRDMNIIFYALITVLVCGRVLDYVIYGSDEAKMLYIITDYPEKIAERLLQELDAGITFLHGHGAYTGKEKKVILCASPKREAPMIEEIVKEEDPYAFMIVTSASEIYGEGYKDFFGEVI